MAHSCGSGVDVIVPDEGWCERWEGCLEAGVGRSLYKGGFAGGEECALPEEAEGGVCGRTGVGIVCGVVKRRGVVVCWNGEAGYCPEF